MVSITVASSPWMLVKTKESQSIITKKFNPIFREKANMDWCDLDKTVAGTKDYQSPITKVKSKVIWLKTRKPSRNITYSTVPLDWTKLFNMLWRDGNSNFFQWEVVLQAKLSPGISSGWIQPGHWDRVRNRLTS